MKGENEIMKLPDKVYDILKWIMFLGVPVGSFIISIITAVNTGDPSAVITAVFTGLASLAGVIIKISDGEYRKENKNA